MGREGWAFKRKALFEHEGSKVKHLLGHVHVTNVLLETPPNHQKNPFIIES
jgi:hypothetical protein